MHFLILDRNQSGSGFAGICMARGPLGTYKFFLMAESFIEVFILVHTAFEAAS